MSEPGALKDLERLVMKGSIVRVVQWSGGNLWGYGQWFHGTPTYTSRTKGAKMTEHGTDKN